LDQQLGQRNTGQTMDAGVSERFMARIRALQEIVARAASLADTDSASEVRQPIDHAHLIEAATDFKPNYNPLQHELIALNALRMTSFSSMLPWRNRNGKRTDAP